MNFSNKTVLIVFLLLVSLFPVTQVHYDFDEESDEFSTNGRNMDVECSGFTLNDIFHYTYGEFNFQIGSNWNTAIMNSKMYSNGTDSQIFREYTDQLFDGFPGGNNSWLSTDEVDAFPIVSLECIEDIDGIVGIWEGPHHTGESNNNIFSYYKDGLSVTENNYIDYSNSELRDCSGRYAFASSGCQEVPITVSTDLDHSISLVQNEQHNIEFNTLPNLGLQNFTISINLTGVPESKFVFKLPYVNGLRISDYVLEYDDVGGYSIPFNEKYYGDGTLEFDFEISHSNSESSMNSHLYVHLTTYPDPTPDVPDWTEDAPEDGTIIPVGAVDGSTITSWYSGEDGAFFNCDFVESDWSSHVSEYGLEITSPNGSVESDAECSIENWDGMKNVETRNYTFGYPFSISTDDSQIRISGQAIVIPTGMLNQFNLTMYSMQMPHPYFGTFDSVVIDQQNYSEFGLEMKAIDLETMALDPGPVWIGFIAKSENMLDYEMTIGPMWWKYSLPPNIGLTKNFDNQNVTWNSEYTFTMRGTVSDVDGEAISMSLELCGEESGTFSIVGMNWELDADIYDCVSKGVEQFLVNIKATDESGNESNLILDITPDSDRDGYNDYYDEFPLDSTEWIDTDYDGFGDNSDAFPDDENEWKDTDLDGVGDNSDSFPEDPTEATDTDMDGVGDNSDIFPSDPSETTDSDNDGVGDNSDAFPNNPNETSDLDGDGIGDNSDDCKNTYGNSTIDLLGCLDNDGDGWSNLNDSFINNSEEWMDSDNDGVGDNSDAFPNDDSETKDSDGDGVGDNEQLRSEQQTKLVIISVISFIVVAAIIVGLYLKNKKTKDLNFSEVNQNRNIKQEVNSTNEEQLSVSGPIVTSQWTDDTGYTWKKMDDGTTYWWDGENWKLYQ